MKTRTFIIRAGLARMLCMGFVLASVTLAAAIGAASASSPGELDQSFGVGGTVVTSSGRVSGHVGRSCNATSVTPRTALASTLTWRSPVVEGAPGVFRRAPGRPAYRRVRL